MNLFIVMIVTNVYSIVDSVYPTTSHTKYCRKRFLKYSILCGDIYKAIFKKNFFKLN